jgi:hypothetical protein
MVARLGMAAARPEGHCRWVGSGPRPPTGSRRWGGPVLGSLGPGCSPDKASNGDGCGGGWGGGATVAYIDKRLDGVRHGAAPKRREKRKWCSH